MVHSIDSKFNPKGKEYGKIANQEWKRSSKMEM